MIDAQQYIEKAIKNGLPIPVEEYVCPICGKPILKVDAFDRDTLYPVREDDFLNFAWEKFGEDYEKSSQSMRRDFFIERADQIRWRCYSVPCAHEGRADAPDTAIQYAIQSSAWLQVGSDQQGTFIDRRGAEHE